MVSAVVQRTRIVQPGPYGRTASQNPKHLSMEATMEMLKDAADVLRVSDNQLSKLLGKTQRHHVSEWRHGKRGMSQKFTARLNKLLVLRIQGQPVSTWEGYLRLPRIKQIFSLRQNPIFPQGRTAKVRTGDDVLFHKPKPVLDYEKSMVIVDDNEFFPLAPQELPTEWKLKEIQHLKRRRSHVARAKGTRNDIFGLMENMGFLIITAVIALLVCIIALVFLQKVFLGEGQKVETLAPTALLLGMLAPSLSRVAFIWKRPKLDALEAVDFKGFENLIIYDIKADATYALRVATQRLVDNLDIRCRYRPASNAPALLGLVAGGAVGFAITTIGGFAFLSASFPGADPIPVMIFSIVFGVVGAFVGCIPGYIYVPRLPLAPQPLWIVIRRADGQIVARIQKQASQYAELQTIIAMSLEDRVDELMKENEARPKNDQLTKDEIEKLVEMRRNYIDDKLKDSRTAEVMYELAGGHNLKALYSSRSQGMGQRLAVGAAFATLLGTLFIAFIMFTVWTGN